MIRIVGGLSLVAVSVFAAIWALGRWIEMQGKNPLEGWVVFGLGLLGSTAAALLGVWIILGVFKDDNLGQRDESNELEEGKAGNTSEERPKTAKSKIQ